MALFGAFVQVHLATGRSVALPNDTVRESAPYQHGERLAAELLRLADATSQTPENRSALITAVEDRLDIATRLLRVTSLHGPLTRPFVLRLTPTSAITGIATRDTKQHSLAYGQRMSEERLDGEVTSYGDDRGFGFIRDASGIDYFVRFNDIEMEGYRTLKVGQRVSFLLHRELPAGDAQAWHVRVIDEARS